MPDQTVFVTGATGFIAKHIVLQLLDAGYRVRGSVRAPGRADEVRDAIAPHLEHASALERLDFVTLDLTRDDGWAEALDGADALMHTASPFPMSQPKDEEEIIRPAVDGAVRALRAAKAADVGRVVLTSSVVAVEGTDLPPGRPEYTEDDWTETDRQTTTPYAKSKTLAERAAWSFAENEAPDLALTAINPSLVLGPPLDKHYGTSIAVVERILRARDPMLPQFGFSVVDVRDVARAHLLALEREASIGKRIIVADRFMWMQDMAEILKAAHPDRRIVTRRAPNIAVRGLALFDRAVASIVPILGKSWSFSNAGAKEMLGLDFIPAEEAVRASADWLVRNTDI